jgi:hypothetical protein
MSPVSGTADVITISVASASSSSTTTPTGTLTVVIDGRTVTSFLALSQGSATYTFSSTVTGTHQIAADYSGDSRYASSTGSLTVTVLAAPSFSLAATSIAVSAGSTGSSTITITPQNGYTGTIGWSISSSPSLTNGCFSLPNATVSGTSAVSATMTIYTSASACAGAGLSQPSGPAGKFRLIAAHAVPDNHGFPAESGITGSPAGPVLACWGGTASLAMGSLLFAGLAGRRSRRRYRLAGACLLGAICLALTACGGGSSSSTPSPSPNSSTATKGSYTISIVGTDTSSASITASTTMVLTID